MGHKVRTKILFLHELLQMLLIYYQILFYFVSSGVSDAGGGRCCWVDEVRSLVVDTVDKMRVVVDLVLMVEVKGRTHDADKQEQEQQDAGKLTNMKTSVPKESNCRLGN